MQKNDMFLKIVLVFDDCFDSFLARSVDFTLGEGVA
jgi:hypothetical protein